MSYLVNKDPYSLPTALKIALLLSKGRFLCPNPSEGEGNLVSQGKRAKESAILTLKSDDSTRTKASIV
jgi:hypothetical protein